MIIQKNEEQNATDSQALRQNLEDALWAVKNDEKLHFIQIDVWQRQEEGSLQIRMQKLSYNKLQINVDWLSVSLFSLYYRNYLPFLGHSQRQLESSYFSKEKILAYRLTHNTLNFVHRHPPLLTKQQIKKFDSDDLNLIAYNPKRDDFEHVS